MGKEARADRRVPDVRARAPAAAAGQRPGRRARRLWSRADRARTAQRFRYDARCDAARYGRALRALGCRFPSPPRGGRPGSGDAGRVEPVFVLKPRMEFEHRPVLLEPTVDALLLAGFGGKGAARSGRQDDAQAGERAQRGVFVDGTFGRGGHSRELLRRLGGQARLVVFDKDPQAIAVATELAADDSRVTVVHGGFGAMQEALAARGIGAVDGVMLDLGVSSPQLDDAGRGFSFMREGPLDMR